MKELIGRIVVIEHEALLQRMLRRALVRKGYAVEEVSSGPRLLTEVAGASPSIIVLGVGFRGGDAGKVLSTLKGNVHTNRIPIVVWSSNDADIDGPPARPPGADDYVRKGPPSLVVNAIESILTGPASPSASR